MKTLKLWKKTQEPKLRHHPFLDIGRAGLVPQFVVLLTTPILHSPPSHWFSLSVTPTCSKSTPRQSNMVSSTKTMLSKLMNDMIFKHVNFSIPNGDFGKYLLKKNCCLEKGDVGMKLKRTSNYYYQLQEQLFTLPDKKFTDFVVCGIDQHGNANIVCDRIYPDPQHCKTVMAKLQFFLGCARVTKEMSFAKQNS